METKNSQKVAQFFSCKACDYSTVRANDFAKHLLTRKHLMETNGNKKLAQICQNCGKSYSSRSGLWKHQKTCNVVLASTDELLRTLIEELREKPTTTHIENKVNINVFLHQQCSGAINFQEFISNLQVTVADLERTGTEGYVAGMSQLLVDQLSLMDLRQRPIHCADKKRLHFYVKSENAWSKDKGETVSTAIDEVAQQQIARIKEWEEQHLGWESNASETEAYLSMVREGMGGATQGERERNKREVTKVVGEQLCIRDAMHLAL